MEIIREDPESARFIIEKLISKPEQRRIVLEFFADLVQVANASPDKWGITLGEYEVALNMGGGFYGFAILKEKLKLYWLGDSPPEPPEAVIGHERLVGSRRRQLSISDFLEWKEQLRPRIEALYAFANSWSKSPLLASARQSHSPGVLRYIEQELGIPPLPNPVERATFYWRVATREGGTIDCWPAMRQGGFVSIGWKELGDLNQMLDGLSPEEGRKAIGEKLVSMTPDLKSPSHYAGQWYRFAIDVQVGDIVAAMNGQRLLGLGVITGEYEFDSKDELQPHHHSVQWHWEGDEAWPTNVRGTLRNVTNDAAGIALIRSLLKLKIEDESTPKQETDTMPDNHALNTILYGPPGTGKTYETARRAVAIIDGEAKTQEKDRSQLMERYQELQKKGQIAFVTFHQSYSYEDFVEGIRPVMDESTAEGGPRYQIMDGILKELALMAVKALLKPKVVPAGVVTFSTLWDALIDRVASEPDFRVPGLGNSEYKLEISKPGNLAGTNLNGRAKEPYFASRRRIEQVFEKLPIRQKPTSSMIKTILGVESHASFIGAVVEELRRMAPQTAPVASAQLAPPMRDDILAVLEQRSTAAFEWNNTVGQENTFVLIVDEINRGNISKILGELITLLEDDKRLGKENALTVTLPYSRETFGLPANLYLIGTMNTADKSLALLDVALRRRFEFEELAPNFDECKPSLALEMHRVLVELNRRITLRKDRDHRIGHAFFMNVGDSKDEFDKVFKRKVVPLLQEYFYNDWEGARYVLGDRDGKESFVVPLPGAQEKGARNKWQWYTDTVTAKSLSPLAALVANYGPDTDS